MNFQRVFKIRVIDEILGAVCIKEYAIVEEILIDLFLSGTFINYTKDLLTAPKHEYNEVVFSREEIALYCDIFEVNGLHFDRNAIVQFI